MKKLLSVVLALSLCLTAMMGCFTVSAAETNSNTKEETEATITVGNAGAKAGENVAITVTGANFTDVCAAQLKITLPKELTLVSIFKGENELVNNSDGYDYAVKDNVINTVEIYNFTGTNETITTTSFVLTVNATVSATAEHKDYTIDAEIDGANIDEKWLNITVTDGTLTVNHNIAYKDNTGDTHTPYCTGTGCDYVGSATAHTYTDGTCVCGKTEQAEIVKFDLFGANVIMNDSLDMKFAFAKNEVADWAGHYVIIERTYSDGRAKSTINIPCTDWEINGNYYVVTYAGIAAKEMIDTVTVTIYNADGKAVSNPWVDGLRAYAMRQLSKIKNELQKTMVVDMLNYGAAAQQYFGYAEDNLANNQLTTEQASWATKNIELDGSLTQSAKHFGTNVILKSSIEVKMAFTGVSSDMYAKVSFTRHTGASIEYEVKGDELTFQGSYLVIPVNDLALADAFQTITLEIYNADGSIYTTTQDSIQDYIERNANEQPLYQAVIKYSSSAHAYLHREK